MPSLNNLVFTLVPIVAMLLEVASSSPSRILLHEEDYEGGLPLIARRIFRARTEHKRCCRAGPSACSTINLSTIL